MAVPAAKVGTETRTQSQVNEVSSATGCPRHVSYCLTVYTAQIGLRSTRLIAPQSVKCLSLY